MKLKVIIILASLITLGSAPLLSADETWQGNAAVSLRGELDRDGYFAASNSFPPGTKILVTNLANTRSVVVTVRQRLNGATNVFLMLSSRAATELGMNPVDIARIKTQVVGISSDLTGGVTDFAYNRDTDTNPAYGTPDVGKVLPDDRTVVVENTPLPSPSPTPRPSPTPLPTPTPFVDTTVTDSGVRDPDKDRFSTPVADQEADVSWHHAPLREDREKLRDVELKEARIPIREKGEAVIITRPKSPETADRLAKTDPAVPDFKLKERETARVDEYQYVLPEEEDVLAILIEPKEMIRDKNTAEEALVTVFERPTLDRETVTAALNDPMLLETERPFVWELHDVRPEGESMALVDPLLPETMKNDQGTIDTYVKRSADRDQAALATHDLPDAKKGDQATVDTYVKRSADRDQAALASHDLPDAKKGDQATVDTYVKTNADKDRVALDAFPLPALKGDGSAEVNTLVRTDPEKEKMALSSHRLPEAREKEKPDVLERTDLKGRDKKSVDLALAPVDPKAVIKPKTDTRTTTLITVVPDNTNNTVKTVPDNTLTVTPDRTNTKTVWDTSADYTKNFYYLQVGVFASRETAEKLLKANPTYPMMIISGKADNASVYKVVVGPLKRDETGTVLYLFKARGYRDAFLRYFD